MNTGWEKFNVQSILIVRNFLHYLSRNNFVMRSYKILL
ncbi:hypothetical protein CEV31_4320 [Brucella thiophenivorans]|uniref:Uncharacterized protein n=1 Tax=Brucella thiophenivorans TaxID=571255 RepID=A0A256FRY4_9HYPH|nr:hypothetical protein CEV31_4320 [Brucella thiophenivorans]